MVTLRPVKLHNPHRAEVLMAEGSIKGSPRKLVVIAAYLPPNITTGTSKKSLEFLTGVVVEANRKHDDAIIVVGGDFN